MNSYDVKFICNFSAGAKCNVRDTRSSTAAKVQHHFNFSIIQKNNYPVIVRPSKRTCGSYLETIREMLRGARLFGPKLNVKGRPGWTENQYSAFCFEDFSCELTGQYEKKKSFYIDLC